MTEHLTHRERLLRTLRRQPVDRVPDYEFRAWVQTIDRWANEAMPVASLAGMGNPPGYLEHYFGTDDAEYGPGLSVNVRLLPLCSAQVLLLARGARLHTVLLMRSWVHAAMQLPQLLPGFEAAIDVLNHMDGITDGLGMIHQGAIY